MYYDSEGVPHAEYGKRRPNMPKSVTCHCCGKETVKVGYGTYACEDCKFVYQFKYGKLVRGQINLHKQTWKDKWGCDREKSFWAYSFTLDENGDFVDCEIPWYMKVRE